VEIMRRESTQLTKRVSKEVEGKSSAKSAIAKANKWTLDTCGIAFD